MSCTWLLLQQGLQPVHLAATYGHVELLRYFGNHPSVDLQVKSQVIILNTEALSLSLSL